MIARMRQALDPAGGEGLRKTLWRLQARWGLAGVLVAIVLILGAVTLVGLVAHRLTQPTAQPLPIAKEPLQTGVEALESGPASAASTPVDAVMRQWSSWPLEVSHSQDLERLTALAQAQGLVIESGRVRRLAVADSPMVQIEIELSLLQPWAKVRNFLASALNRTPHLALQSIRLSRDEPTAAEVDTELVFRWVYRRGEGQ